MTIAIEASGLTKDFEKGRRTIWQRLRGEPDRRETFRAVDGVDLRVETGEVFGILGPNGAGKTTTMRMLATLLEPTSGSARVLGHDLVTEARDIRRRLGAVLSGERSVYWKLTARENLEYFAALYHVPPAQTAERIASILEIVKLTDRADDYVEKFSTGMRQRLVLARALLPAPALLLLDEPTVGLDPQAARDLRERVLQLRDEGRTVLLTTHYMEEADQLCDRIAIVDHGRIVALDTPEGLKRGLKATEVVRLEIGAPEAHDESLVGRLAAGARSPSASARTGRCC
jgi:ABC-2 type transport system ATP-binding protein